MLRRQDTYYFIVFALIDVLSADLSLSPVPAVVSSGQPLILVCQSSDTSKAVYQFRTLSERGIAIYGTADGFFQSCSSSASSLNITLQCDYNNRRFVLTIQNPIHNQVIICIKQTSATDIQTINTTIFIQDPPQISSMTDRQVVEESDLMIECSVLPGNPEDTTIYWTWSGDSDFRKNGSELQILSIKRSSSGNYTCTAENTYVSGDKGKDNKTVYVNVLYPPNVSFMRDIQVAEGSDLSITCSVTPGNPTFTTIYWTSSRDSAFKQTGPALQIPNIHRTRSSNYTCTAENIYSSEAKGTFNQTIAVKVLYPPIITSLGVVEGSHILNERERVKLKCDIDGSPLSTVYWKKVENNTVIHIDRGVRISYLTIHSANCLDTGSYLVSVDNGVGINSENTTNLYVRCSPRRSSIPDTQTSHKINIISGEVLFINYEIISHPTPSLNDIEWNFLSENGSRRISDGIDGFSTTSYLAQTKQRVVLNKMPVTVSDYGKYTVIVKNEIGQLKQDFEVQYIQRVADDASGTSLETIIFGTLFGIFLVISMSLAVVIYCEARKMKNQTDTKEQAKLSDVYDELKEGKKDENKYEHISKDGEENIGRSVYDELQEPKKDENKYEAISKLSGHSEKRTSHHEYLELTQGNEERSTTAAKIF